VQQWMIGTSRLFSRPLWTVGMDFEENVDYGSLGLVLRMNSNA
jgi:hypothetical protein